MADAPARLPRDLRLDFFRGLSLFFSRPTLRLFLAFSLFHFGFLFRLYCGQFSGLSLPCSMLPHGTNDRSTSEGKC